MDTLIMIRPHRRQQGFVLVMTLIILVVLTLSSMAMMMTMRAGVSASGNISFRQAAVRVADVGVDAAFQQVSTRLGGSINALDATDLTIGYYSVHNAANAGCAPSGITTFSPATYNFADSNCAVQLPAPVSGYTLYYVIHRMAANAGPCPQPSGGCLAPPTSSTPTMVVASGTSQEAGADFSTSVIVGGALPLVYYRITVKVAGPRRNNRYVQTFVH